MKKEYLDYAGLKRVLKHLLPGARKIWHGTQVNWEALSETERDKYDQAEILPDEHFSGRTLIKSGGTWTDVAGGHLSWKGTRAELEAALAAGELPEDTEVKVTDDYIFEPVFEYSTEEKRIGTWIDGKKIYRKVIVPPSPIIGGGNSNYAVGIPVKECLHLSLHATISNNHAFKLILNSSHNSVSADTSYVEYNTEINGGSIYWNDSRSNLEVLYFIMEYTKTTD